MAPLVSFLQSKIQIHIMYRGSIIRYSLVFGFFLKRGESPFASSIINSTLTPIILQSEALDIRLKNFKESFQCFTEGRGSNRNACIYVHPSVPARDSLDI